jgi:hypothetical protein
MASSANQLRWTGKPGHYEVYYLTLTDPGTGVGVWIRYTMVAPLASSGAQATCSLWFLTMDPRPGAQPTLARKRTVPVTEMQSRSEAFELRVADAVLTDGTMTGAFDDVSWDLSWTPAAAAYEPVNPVLGRIGVAKTVLVLPHADVAVSGVVKVGAETLELTGVPAGQAHLWGSQHAATWAWAHCNDLASESGSPVPGTFFDGVSAVIRRFGRSFGPNTPVVGCFGGRPFHSTSPRRILTNHSRFDLEGWTFEAQDGARKLVGEVRPVREQLAGVTYHDPDGTEAYCYNSETASARLELHERRSGGWEPVQTLVSTGRCHFEFGTREPVPGVALLTT